MIVKMASIDKFMEVSMAFLTMASGGVMADSSFSLFKQGESYDLPVHMPRIMSCAEYTVI